MSIIIVVIILVFVALLAFACYHTWNVYKTNFASRTNEDASQAFMLVAEMKNTQEDNDASSAKPLPVVLNQPAKKKSPPPLLNPSLLEGTEQLSFLSLKLELPDYEILTQVDASALFVEKKAPQACLDFVVCHKRTFAPIAVIVFKPSRHNTPEQDRVLQMLKRAKLRVLHWPADKPFIRGKVRTQVLGEETLS